MSETERLLQLLDKAIEAAGKGAFAHALKVKDMVALRAALLASLAQNK